MTDVPRGYPGYPWVPRYPGYPNGTPDTQGFPGTRGTPGTRGAPSTRAAPSTRGTSPIFENVSFFLNVTFLMKSIKSIEKCNFQALGPSKSEPPSKTMSDGTGFVEIHALFGPFMADRYTYSKCRFPSLGTIKIGTAVENHAFLGWFIEMW